MNYQEIVRQIHQQLMSGLSIENICDEYSLYDLMAIEIAARQMGFDGISEEVEQYVIGVTRP